jgi:hypothetical protein
MFAAVCISLAVTLLMGVRHEPRLRAWAMNPRTPRRVAHTITRGVTATGTALASAVLTAAGATILVVAFVGAVDQAAGTL